MAMVQPALPLGDEVALRPRRFQMPGLDKIDDALVWRAITLIDGSELVDRIAKWKDEDRRGPGGRPETFPARALLVAMLLCALTNQPMLATSFTHVLFRQISATMRHALGVPRLPDRLDQKGWDARYRRVRTRFHGLIGLIDPSPTPKNQRLSEADFNIFLELRRSARSDAEWSERDQRLAWFINEILEMSIQVLPREIRRVWKGSVAVDATVVPAFARPDRRERRKTKGKKPPVLTHSSDPDADWYHRDRSDDAEADAEPKGKFSVWGYEATIVVSGSDDPDRPQSMPTLVMGMAPLHKPGTQVGQNALRALSSIHGRGHCANFLAGDRAYTNAKPEDFQLPARALGYQLVLDYKIDQLGRQGSFMGMILVDGAWYCPEMPEVLVTCTKDRRMGVIDGATYEARLDERRNYAILSKGRPDAEGHLRLRCPASNPNPVARCELKPASEVAATRRKTRIPLTAAGRAHPPKICTQQSITVPPDQGAKYLQALEFESPQWRSVYGLLRACVEGMNGFVKDGAHEALDDPERRRIRGVAPQSVFVAFLLCVANLRKIDAFLAQRDAIDHANVRRLPRRRTTKSIGDWVSNLSAPGSSAGSNSGPDPPSTA